MKCHTENRPLRITSVEILSHWVKDQLKHSANRLNRLNQKYAPFPCILLVSFDVVSPYPNITLDDGMRAIRHKTFRQG